MQTAVTYIETQEASNDVNLGNLFSPENGFVCISMYVKMCALCTIKLTLRSSITQKVLNEKTYENVSNIILQLILSLNYYA